MNTSASKLIRWAGGGLAVGTVAPLVLSLLLPHEFIRLAAVPVGIALALLGYALWSERREKVSEPLSRRSTPHSAQPEPSRFRIAPSGVAVAPSPLACAGDASNASTA